MQKIATLTIEVPPEIAARLEAVARDAGRPVRHVALDAILDHLEDVEDAASAEKVMREVDAGRMKTYSLEEVMRHLDLTPDSAA